MLDDPSTWEDAPVQSTAVATNPEEWEDAPVGSPEDWEDANPVTPMTPMARNFMYGLEEEGSDLTDASLYLERKFDFGGRFGYNTDEGFFYHGLKDIYGDDWDDLDDDGKRSRQQSVLNEHLNEKYADVLEAGGDKTIAAMGGSFFKEVATPSTFIPGTMVYKTFKAGSKAATAIKMVETSAAGALWGSEISVMEQLAKEGTIDPAIVAKEAATAAIVAPLLPVAGKGMVKFGKKALGITPSAKEMSKKQASKFYWQMEDDLAEGMGTMHPSKRVPEEVYTTPHGSPERKAAVEEWIAKKYKGALLDPDTFLKKADQTELPTMAPDMAAVATIANKNGRLAGKLALPKEILQSMDHRINNISPVIAKRLRDMEAEVLRRSHEHGEVAHVMIEKIGQLKDKDIIWDLLQDQQWDTVLKGLKRSGLDEEWDAVRSVRNLLETLGNEKEKYNVISKILDNYFPRIARDKDGLFAALGKTEQDQINKALGKARDKAKKPLTEYEESMIITQVLAAPAGRGGPLTDKSRKIMGPLPEHLKQFYHKPEDALHIYMRQAADDIETAKFFGKFNKAKVVETGESVVSMPVRMHIVENSVGALVNAEGIEGAAAIELKSLLNSIFGMGKVHTPKAISELKAWTYAGLLGNVRSTATQFGDMASSMQANGFMNTAHTILNRSGRAILGKEQLIHALKDGGIANIGHEMASQAGSQKYLRTVMSASGFRQVDMAGKNVFAESALRKAWKTAAKDEAKLYDELVPRWGLEDTKQLVADLRATKGTKDSTDLMKAYAFEELMDWQPITPSSLPQAYADNPRMRLFYTLSTWNIRMANQQYNRIVKRWQKGGKENQVEAVKELAKFGMYFGTLDTGMDYIKDAMNGRETAWHEFPERAFENLKGMLFLDRYSTEGIADKPASTIKEKVADAPPIGFADDVWAGTVGLGKIIAGTAEEKDIKNAHKLTNFLPLVGPMIYNRTGGNEKANKEFAKRQRERTLGRIYGN